MVSSSSTVAPPRLARSGRVIGLISAAHFASHFYLLLIPPLFPILKEAFGVGYTELGLALTAFSFTTGVTQAPVGFLVDRLGARRILIAGLLLEAGAFIGIGLFPGYGALVGFMIVAGLANAVYHPADYAILNASVDPRKMGRAFSIHTASGMLGNAVAPVAMVGLLGFVDWQVGLVVCGGIGLALGLVITANASVLRDPAEQGMTGDPDPAARTGLRLLFSVPILLGVLFFVGIAFSGLGIQSFSVSSLTILHDVSVAEAATVLSMYLFASPLGVLCGGWVADRIRHHHFFAAACFVVVALAAFAVAAFPLGLEVIAVLFGVAGFFSGCVSPSRDMLIRSLTPPSEIGKVFGFVSTGFNIGGMVAPVLFGYLLDHSEPQIVFWVVGWASLATVLTVITTGQQRRPYRL